MDADPHVSNQKDEAVCGTSRDDSLLSTLAETFRRLEAVRRSQNHPNQRVEGMDSAEEDEEGDEEQVEAECRRNILAALRELSVFHRDRVTAWRTALRENTCRLLKSPPEGGEQPHPETHTGTDGCLNLSFREVEALKQAVRT